MKNALEVASWSLAQNTLFMDEDRGILPCRAYLLFASHSLERERERGERDNLLSALDLRLVTLETEP